MCRSDRIGGWEGDLDGERCDMRAGRSRSPMSYLSCSRLFSRPVHVRFRFGPVCVVRSRFAIYRQVSSVHVLNFKGYAHSVSINNQRPGQEQRTMALIQWRRANAAPRVGSRIWSSSPGSRARGTRTLQWHQVRS